MLVLGSLNRGLQSNLGDCWRPQYYPWPPTYGARIVRLPWLGASAIFVMAKSVLKAYRIRLLRMLITTWTPQVLGMIPQNHCAKGRARTATAAISHTVEIKAVIGARACPICRFTVNQAANHSSIRPQPTDQWVFPKIRSPL